MRLWIDDGLWLMSDGRALLVVGPEGLAGKTWDLRTQPARFALAAMLSTLEYQRETRSQAWLAGKRHEAHGLVPAWPVAAHGFHAYSVSCETEQDHGHGPYRSPLGVLTWHGRAVVFRRPGWLREVDSTIAGAPELNRAGLAAIVELLKLVPSIRSVSVGVVATP